MVVKVVDVVELVVVVDGGGGLFVVVANESGYGYMRI